MKKIALTLGTITMLFCLFAISVSAEITTYDDAPEKTNIIVSTDDVVVFDDGFCCPTGYVFKDTTSISNGRWGSPSISSAFDFTYINGKTGKEYTFANIVELDFPQGLTSMGNYLAHKVTTLKKVSFPDSLTSLGGSTFEGCTSIEECVFEHNEGSGLTVLPNYMFSSASSLKAFSMPDCVTTLSGEGHHFANCSSLSAVYLSKNLTTIVGSRSDRALFDYCSKLYFVDEPFSYDSIPEKQTVYHFPSMLEKLPNQCIFRACSSLNEVLVFGENMLSVPNMYTFERTGTKSIVFYGAVEKISIGAWTNISVYLVNENANIANVNSDVERASNLVTVKNVYLCKSNKAYLPVKDSGATTVQLVEQESPVVHLAEKTVDAPAKCEVDAGLVTYCFCGYEMSKIAVEGTALSHNYDYLNNENARLVAISYSDYAKAGVKTVCCANCGENKDFDASSLFVAQGYSAKEQGGSGISIGYAVNRNAIKEYTDITGKSFEYGFFAVLQDKLGENDIMSQEGEFANGVISTDYTLKSFDIIEFKITGFTTEAQMQTKIALGVYVFEENGEETSVSYLQVNAPNEGEKYTFVSYRDFVPAE